MHISLDYILHLTDNVSMKVTNTTNIPAHIITYFLRDLGISKADHSLTIEYGDCSGRGTCHRREESFTIILSGEATLETLAHELKHVEQHVSGLSEYMRLERELTPYRQRWHEIEAREYARAWKGKRI